MLTIAVVLSLSACHFRQQQRGRGPTRRGFNALKVLNIRSRLKEAQDKGCHPAKRSRHHVALDQVEVWSGSDTGHEVSRHLVQQLTQIYTTTD
jgi:hypothetical protein